jgi:hypothetical protein
MSLSQVILAKGKNLFSQDEPKHIKGMACDE